MHSCLQMKWFSPLVIDKFSFCHALLRNCPTRPKALLTDHQTNALASRLLAICHIHNEPNTCNIPTHHSCPPAAPKIFNPPPSPAHAIQYLPGCHATTPHPPLAPISTLPTYSPDSVCATSSTFPSSLPPTTKLPSKLNPTLLTAPVRFVSVRLQTQSVVS